MPRASVAVAVDEGILLAEYAVRLRVKNAIEVATIGEDAAFDESAFESVVATEWGRIAAEQRAVADRLDAEEHGLRARGRARHVHDYSSEDRRNLRHRRDVSRTLARIAHERATDADAVSEMIERAREDAWREVATAIEAVFDVGVRPPREPSEARRHRVASLAEEIAALVTDGRGRVEPVVRESVDEGSQ